MGLLNRAQKTMICGALIFAFFMIGCERPKKDSNAMENIDARVEALMSEMTLEDKLNLMDGDTPFWSGFGEMVGTLNCPPCHREYGKYSSCLSFTTFSNRT